jgi:hypothetical protein
MIPDVGLVQVVGEPGTLKSFFMCHVGLAVASGQQDCFGFPVLKHGAVLYIAAEGAGAFQFRIRAWCHEHGVNPHDIPFRIIPMAVNLRAPDFQAQLLALVAEVKPIVIVIDTLARCTPGAEENSTRDMGEVIAFCSEIQKASSCAVAFVHHPTKSDPKGGGRGSSAIFGAVDTEIRISKEDTDEGALELPIKISCAKQKDDGRFPELDLMGCVVPVRDLLGREMAHESGRSITSIVLRMVDNSDAAQEAAQKRKAKEHDIDLKVLQVMQDYPGATSQQKIREYTRMQFKDVADAVSRILQAQWAEPYPASIALRSDGELLTWRLAAPRSRRYNVTSARPQLAARARCRFAATPPRSARSRQKKAGDAN